MLRVFGHPVVTCYDVLRHVTTCWVLLAQICKWSDFSCNICGCCSRLARFMQQCCAQACALVRFSTRNMSQHVAIGGQTRATCTCCTQQCCDRLAGTCKCWANNVGICCVDIVPSFGRGLIIRLRINTGKQMDHPSRRTIWITRIHRRITGDNSSERIILLSPFLRDHR